MAFNVITHNSQEDLIKIFRCSLGIKKILANNELDNKSISEIDELWEAHDNFIFKNSYKSNYKASLWEIEYWVRAHVRIPEDMRAV